MAGRAERTLLERDEALAILDAALADLVTGTSGFVIVDGAAGIGKSALVDELVTRARRAGITVASGAATHLESDLAYGVVRQLFEPLLAAADEQARRHLVAGAAELARPVLEIFPAAAPAMAPPGAAADRSFSVAHGLYWLTANVAEGGPVAIVIDDAQWYDAPSMRFLAYLARRLKGLSVLLVVALRSGEEPTDPESLAALTVPGAAVQIRPDPLSEDAVAVVAEQLLGSRPAAEFVAACRAATGGVPFLVHELLKALAADGVEPTAEAAARVFGFSPDTVAHATLLRLSQLGALHSAGLVEGGDAGLAMLEEPVDVLTGCGHAPLEQARSQTDLGAALRRSGQRAVAREPLRIGLSLAERCGAQRLADRAEDELRLA
ncbi:MAG: AAA family ATPase, partial [Jatrophihabitans sp.]|uniref:AAA family ATPase n=1 Tax=Jatrophihabitans sp. TaxID=1932789 RepID=UPI0039155BF9